MDNPFRKPEKPTDTDEASSLLLDGLADGSEDPLTGDDPAVEAEPDAG